MSMTNKQIAKEIMAQYNDPDRPLSYNRDCTQKVFCIDGLTIRCGVTYSEVRAVADKFEKGLPRGGRTENSVIPAAHNTKWRKFSITTFRDFIEDLEPENALEYFRLFNPADLPAGVRNTVRRLTQ